MEIRFWWHSSNEASYFDGVCGLVVGTLAYKLNTSDFDRSWMKGGQHRSPARGRVGICLKSPAGAVFSAIAWNVQGFHVAGRSNRVAVQHWCDTAPTSQVPH